MALLVMALLGLLGWTLAMIWLILPARISAISRRIDDLERKMREERPASPSRAADPDVVVRQTVAPPVTRPMPTAPPTAAATPDVPRVMPGPRVAPAPPTDTPATEPPPSFAWELIVGANWLNRVGVLAIVIGIALGVAYTVGHTGPLGRIAIGYASSFVLLAGGTWLERRLAYRSYAAGLVAGGWAGTYFTTYAAHAVEAARVIDSAVVAASALIAVAAAMVAYSLRYRSQTITGFAYLIAYATLALTPLSGFALVASVPLSASLLLVAQRFGWSRMATLGVISTYGVFALRGAILPGRIEAGSTAPYLALAAYWLTFEAGDILALRSRPAAPAAPVPLFALNAVGFVGASLLQLPAGEPARLSNLLATTAVAYLASAFVRARLLHGRATGDDLAAQAFSGASQGAIGVAAGLTMWAIGLRFSGSREVTALLLTAEMLFVTGVAFADRVVRIFGGVAAAVTALRALQLVAGNAPMIDWPWRMHAWVPALVLVAVVCYVNRETLRSRGIGPSGIEWGYSPAASLLALQVLASEVPAPYLGLALLGASAFLIEIGVRRAAEYRYQAYALGAIGLVVILERQLGGRAGVETLTAEAWRTLPLAVVLAYASAARLVWPRTVSRAGNDLRFGAAAAASAGTTVLVLFEWRIAAPLHAAPAWAFTALLLALIAVWRGWPGFIWQAYAVVLPAVLRAMGPIVTSPPRGAPEHAVAWAGAVIGLLFAVGVIGRRSIAARGQPSDAEDVVRISVLITASVSLPILIFREADPSIVTLTLAFAGLVLIGGGLLLGERALRLSGLAIFGLAILRLFTSDLVRLEGLTRIVSFIVSGLVLLAVSWIYTRFREEIRRYL
jgi:Predicted membrane protein (DUF2339)